MFCSVLSAAISGTEILPVSVEVDVSTGMPGLTMVGFVSSQVREAQERVRTAIRNLGLSLPPRRITINLSPGDIRKDGTRFDLPIAAAVLEAMGAIPEHVFSDTLLLGELHLDGTTGEVPGVLPGVICARDMGCRLCIVPSGNLVEALAVQGIRSVGIRSLQDLIAVSRGEIPVQPSVPGSLPGEQGVSGGADFSDIHGQKTVKRAAQIAAAGFHNLLLSGPPGSGKSMTARRIPTIMPPLTPEESLEISKIYSIVGLLPEGTALLHTRPFRAPHHTITPASLLGGGTSPRPGEITLAHRGVLFLDELPEMNPATLEMLRQPLEDRRITISRTGGTCTFPASFILVGAMNPCPCGWYPNRNRCTCSPKQIMSYRSRISQALLDRMDLRCEVPATEYGALTGGKQDEVSSEILREGVIRAAEAQKDRYEGLPFIFNSELGPSDIPRFCQLTGEASRLMEAAFHRFLMSARSYHHTLKTARTIADIEGASLICEAHISEALCYRSTDPDIEFSVQAGVADRQDADNAEKRRGYRKKSYAKKKEKMKS